MSVAAELVGSARRYRGLSGHALARLAGASQPGLSVLERGSEDATTGRLERLLRPLGYQLAALPTRLGTASSAAEAIRAFLDRPAGADLQGALRTVWQLAADLRAADPALRVALAVTPPAPTGDPRFDALLAGVVEHLLVEDELPLPRWLGEPSRRLTQPWDVEPVPALRAEARTATPPSLAAHGVYLAASELENV